jgi:hypothetical protein
MTMSISLSDRDERTFGVIVFNALPTGLGSFAARSDA